MHPFATPCFLALALSVVSSNVTVVNVPDNRTLQEIEYKEGTSVEAQYHLPFLNASEDGVGMTASLSRVLDFYNTEKLRRVWKTLQGMLSGGCRGDVREYIKGLDSARNWALKMDDASGRYSTGWFWGNHYWAGSQTLCENLSPKDQRFLQLTSEQAHNRTRRNTQTANKKVASPSQAAQYKPGRLLYTSVPPFSVSFFMLRVHINSSFTTEERIIHVGLCLPHSCNDQDVQNILEESSKTSPRVTVQVEAVRSPHNRFSLWDDTTFRILCVVTAMVSVLLITGTAYDYYLDNLKLKKKILRLNCTTYITSQSGAEKSSIKLDMNVPEFDVKTGNSSTYVVNQVENKFQSVGNGEIKRKKCTKSAIMKMLVKECFLAFSVKTNMKTICDQTVGNDTIPVVHGLKSISMAWVILGHTCIIAFKYSDNMEYRKVVQKEFLFQTIANGAFSVDTFFFTSGLLVAYLYFRTNAKGKLDLLNKGHGGFTAGALHFFGLVIYRFARLTVPYLFVLGVVEVCMKWFNYNSIFEPPTMDHVNCHEYWWRNILYINTLFPVEEMCMLWSWYLSNDTQFYVIGAIMLILATSHFKTAAALLITFMISSWLTTGYIAYSNSHIPNSDDPMALFDKIYDKPWTRLGPYFIGMSVGWILFKTDCTIRMSKFVVVLGWLTSLTCLLSLVYGLYDADLSPVVGAAYSSLSHSAWAIGLAWIAIACSTGHGGFANTILSSTVLYPLSRVTYCAYLLHPIVIRMMTMSMDSPLHLGGFVMIIIFLGQVVASYFLSFVVSLAFEAPVVSMLRMLTKLAPNNKMKEISS